MSSRSSKQDFECETNGSVHLDNPPCHKDHSNTNVLGYRLTVAWHSGPAFE